MICRYVVELLCICVGDCLWIRACGFFWIRVNVFLWICAVSSALFCTPCVWVCEVFLLLLLYDVLCDFFVYVL